MRRTRTGQDRLTADDLGDNDAVLLTIESAAIRSFSSDYLSGGDKKLVLTFKEFGPAEYVLNATSFQLLQDKYGGSMIAGFGSWVGRECVLIKTETTDPRTGDKITSVWVAKPADWDAAVREIRGVQPTSGVVPAGVKRTPAKKKAGGKRASK